MANELPDLSFNDFILHSSVYGLVGSFAAVGNSTANGDYKCGIRFDGLDIGQGQSISMAKLVLPYSSVGSTGGNWKWKAYGIDEDDTSGFGDPFGRSLTTANNSYDEGSPTSGGTKELDVKSIMQEIVDRGGWSRYNALGFIFDNNGSSANVFAFFNLSTSYLIYRTSAEPNFTPTATTVSAPSLPTAQDVGMKFSQPGVSVLTATDDQCYLTTRKFTVKIVDEDVYTATAAETITIPHNLGYVPYTTVFALETDPGATWVKLNRNNLFEDHPFYFVDEDNLYLHSSDTGEKFYYRIFLDRIV